MKVNLIVNRNKLWINPEDFVTLLDVPDFMESDILNFLNGNIQESNQNIDKELISWTSRVVIK